MKNKKNDQIAAKQKHKEQFKAKRRAEPSLDRSVAKLFDKPIILIVCEGKNTEPSYFKQFKNSLIQIEPIGEGYNTISLVNRAKQLEKRKNYDQIWCVFDADPKPDNPNQVQNFNKAIKLAEKNKFAVAYSNQAFEYWFILHLNDHQGGEMHRKDYNKKINDLLAPHNITYDGNGSKIVSEDFFEILNGIDGKTRKKRVDLAIKRAEKNYKKFTHSNHAKKESSTTVFKLVRTLLKYV